MQAATCDLTAGGCHNGGGVGGATGTSNSTSPASPSGSSAIRINPGAVPVENGLGIEAILYRGTPDFGLVKGIGRVGAAVSPTNGEETFFGPPGFETSAAYLSRKRLGDKLESQKFALATAFSLWKNNARGLRRIQVNLGVIGKYNRLTQTAWPGAGISGVVGPLTFGASALKDETVVDSTSVTGEATRDKLRFGTQSISVGLFLTNVALDYSILTIYPEGYDPLKVTLATATLIYGRLLATYSVRTEDSSRYNYNYETLALETKQIKQTSFIGVQYAPWKYFMMGLFHNYYLHQEVSAGLTVFF